MTGNLTQLLGESFNATEVPLGEYELITKGDYVLLVEETEMKPTSKGGTALNVKFQIVGSNFDGRTITERLNLQNDNVKAVEIAFQTLAKIVTACGFEKIDDSSQLHGKKILAHIDIKKGTGTYIDKTTGAEKPSLDQNVIKSYAPMAGNKAPTQEASAPAAAPAGAKKMPWAK